jgi:hypothetical protein
MADPAETRDGLRAKLDAAIFNRHSGGSVSSRWTVDSILDAAMPIIAADRERIRQQAYAEAIRDAVLKISQTMGMIPFGETKEDQPETRVATLIRLRDEVRDLAPSAIPQRGELTGEKLRAVFVKLAPGIVSILYDCDTEVPWDAIAREMEGETRI